MGVDSTHPDYDRAVDNWQLMRDAYEGTIAVKEDPQIYLPVPTGFTAMEDGGTAEYTNYVFRAQFPEITAPSALGMVGLIHKVPSNITLPERLMPLVERATLDGLSLNALHERITQEVLLTGRYGLLADMPVDPSQTDGLPYIAGYKAETIINWSKTGDFFVLNETDLRRDGFEWTEQRQFRVLRLGGDDPEATGPRVYTVSVHAGDNLQENKELVPQAVLGARLGEIPFTVVGSTDVTPEIDQIPLLQVARAALAAYRLDADYRHQLFWSGQATLVIIGLSDNLPTTVGAGVVIGLPLEADAKYVAPDGKTLEAHRMAIQDELTRAKEAGIRLLDVKRSVESGDALKMRMISQTASLITVAINSAKGLERALKHCALFVGANPDEVVVEPNLGFVDHAMTPEEAKAVLEAWMAGVISKQTAYERYQRGQIASHERNFDDEQELIRQEIPDVDTLKPQREGTGEETGGQGSSSS